MYRDYIILKLFTGVHGIGMIFTLKQPSLPWLYQRISAALLIVLLWLHFHIIFKRFMASGTLRYSDLHLLLSNPLYKILEIFFYLLAISHGFYGLWKICLLWVHRDRYRVMLKSILWSIGIAFFVCMAIVVIAI